MLYLVSTPIGNLSDITYRAVEVLKSCEYILCEDTRHSGVLCKRYDITTPKRSYHKFNEAKREEQVLEDLKNGIDIALISDAGTPGVADPGMRLVNRCYDNDIEVTAIPGPCALIQALVLSGEGNSVFQFVYFLPKKKMALQRKINDMLSYDGVSICYESPHRIIKTLKVIHSLNPERTVVIARELTKKFENIHRGTADELIKYFSERKPRGEITLIITNSSTSEVLKSDPY